MYDLEINESIYSSLGGASNVRETRHSLFCHLLGSNQHQRDSISWTCAGAAIHNIRKPSRFWTWAGKAELGKTVTLEFF